MNNVETKEQHESEITNDDNDVNPSLRLNDKEQVRNGSEILSESNETTSDPTSEGQIIRQHKFYIHSSWLAVQSSYFRSLFFGGIKESISPKEVHVQTSESEEQAHLMLLEAMYKIDTLDNASIDELLEVLRLAHKYDVKFVFKKCKYCLQAMVDSIESFEKIMHFIKVENSITDVEDLEKMLQSFLAKEFSPLDKTWHTKPFEELSESTLKCLLSSDRLVAASENTVFHALMHWIKQRGIDKVLESTELPPLLSVVRFELIPIDYLYNMVQHNALAKRFPDFNKHYLRGITYHALSNLSKPRLSCQPVNREASTKSFILYTWVIATEKLDKQAQSGKPIKSDEFWYCGYRMVLIINEVVKIKDLRGNKAVFNAKLSLAVTNLTEQSEVMINWKAASQSFTSAAVGTSTFNKKANESSVDITYSARTASTPVFTTTTSGLFSSPQSTVTASTGTATSALLSSTSPSKPSGGLSFSCPQSTVSTSTGTATTSGLMSSTSSFKPNGGISFSFPQSTVSTSTGTATTSGLFGSPQSTVSTSTGTATTSGLTFSPPPSKPSGAGGFSVGTLYTNTLEASQRNVVKPRRHRFPVQKSPNSTCLSIDVRMSLVNFARDELINY